MNVLERVTTAILLATIFQIIALDNVLADIDRIGPQMRWFITFFMSVGVFQLLILLIHWMIR